MAATAPASAPSTASLLFKMFRWIFLAVLIVVILLMLKKPAPPSSIAAARTTKELTAAATSFDDKIAGLEDAHARGEAGSEVKLSDDELNGALQRSTGALPEAAAPSDQGGGAAPATPKPQLPANLQEESGPVAVKSSQVAMIDDQIVLQFVVDRYGKDIYVTLSTRIGVEDHHLNLHPTGMKIGELSVPIGMAEETVQKKIHEPENWEKMKLPDFVKDVRVEHGELVVTE